MKTLKQYLQEARESPHPNKSPRTLLVTVDDLRDALGILEDDRTLEVKLDYPELDTIAVNFFPPGEERVSPVSLDASTDQPGNQSPTFELSVVRIGDGLPDLRDYATVEVTLDKHNPTKVQLKLRKDEASGE